MTLRHAYIIAAVYAALFCSLCAFAGHALAAPSPHGARCGAEDSASWVWSRCGNRKRGITVKRAYVIDGSRTGRYTVGPCDFARYAARNMIDWRRTPRLRGDYSAHCPR